MVLAERDVRASTASRILDAAFESFREFGLSRITMEDVASRAGLSRQSVYRYFPSKDSLIVALVSREEEKFLDGVRAAFLEHEDVEAALRASVRFVLGYAREHPLLERLLATDQAVFLPYVTTRAQAALERARDTVLEVLLSREPSADRELLRTVLDGTTRATVSYMLTPSDRSPDQIADAVATLMTAVLRKEGSS
jgi:AcrR family transcriptional regulator